MLPTTYPKAMALLTELQKKHIELQKESIELQKENIVLLRRTLDLQKRVNELEAELKVRPASAHGVEKYMAEGANTKRPGIDTGAQSINRGGFENDLEENPVQVNYEVPHR
jgi:hypothetical protein